MSNFLLKVLIEINGVMTKVGSITGTDYKNAVFAYDKSYTAEKTNHAMMLYQQKFIKMI